MKISEKIFWKLNNQFEAGLYNFLNKRKPNGGLLRERKDWKDFLFGGSATLKPSHTEFSIDRDFPVFEQYPFNTCCFCAGTMGASYQDGIRYSIRFSVILARKLGMITQNGFSYLRAPRELSIKYGRLPYEEMPHEINGRGWQEYSTFEGTEEEWKRLLEIAKKYKVEKYEKITSTKEALQVLEAGYVIYSGSVWFQNMNYPFPPEFLLRQQGAKLGGHAWFLRGYKTLGSSLRWKLHNSFGEQWGEGGMAYLEQLFANNQFSMYIESKLNLNS